ncbi:ATP-binding protein [Enterococcus malodoratus]|uniref:ATP-binding protein n=1 Tax=Enterococcus malodoratus TaxID=71451 RepID=UPI003FD5076A
MNAQYDRHLTIFTINSSISGWDEVFKNSIVTAAILDRLVYHSKIFKITEKSYRLQDYQEKLQK